MERLCPRRAFQQQPNRALSDMIYAGGNEKGNKVDVSTESKFET